MTKSDLDRGDLTKDESLDFRFLDSASPSEIEASCLYEYMRESQRLRDELNAQGKSDQGLQSPFLPNLTLSQTSTGFAEFVGDDFQYFAKRFCTRRKT